MTPPTTAERPQPPRPKRFVKWILLGLAGLLLAFCLVLLPCSVKILDGEGWTRSAHSVWDIGQALRSYHEANGQLPPSVVTDKDGRPLYSWRVLLLPYLDEDKLHKQFKLDEPWDSPHNKPLSEQTPRCYVPARGGNDSPGLTRYQVLVGPGTAFERPGLRWDDFTDGLSTTLLVVEAGEAVPWSKPEDLAYDPGGLLPSLGGAFGKPTHFLCYEVGRQPGFIACFADGSVQFIASRTDERTIRGLITRNGGETVDVSRLE